MWLGQFVGQVDHYSHHLSPISNFHCSVSQVVSVDRYHRCVSLQRSNDPCVIRADENHRFEIIFMRFHKFIVGSPFGQSSGDPDDWAVTSQSPSVACGLVPLESST